MEIPLRKGRFFTRRINADKPQVVIIDEKFAQRFWPEAIPSENTCGFDPKKPMTIVGVVGVVKQYGLETDGKIATYFPQQQHPILECFWWCARRRKRQDYLPRS